MCVCAVPLLFVIMQFVSIFISCLVFITRFTHRLFTHNEMCISDRNVVVSLYSVLFNFILFFFLFSHSLVFQCVQHSSYIIFPNAMNFDYFILNSA